VILQKYKGGGVADIIVFELANGLTYKLQNGEKSRTESDITPWLGRRAGMGKLPPSGFRRDNKFR
jgi:topoisomerase-4 subunit A